MEQIGDIQRCLEHKTLKLQFLSDYIKMLLKGKEGYLFSEI